MEKLVSVILLTYNNLNYIDCAINSIISQDYSNIELIIGDDCSKYFDINRIENIIKLQSGNIKKIIIYRNSKNLGTVKNLNKAIKLSNGEIIVPLACDDEFFNNNTISQISNFFDVNNCQICTAKRLLLDGNNNFKGIIPNSKQIEYLGKSTDELLKLMIKGNFIFGACTYYKKEIFEKYGYFDESFILLEDYPYYLKLLSYNVKIKFLNEITIKYRTTGVSSGKKHPLLIEDDKKVYTSIIFPLRNKIGIKTYRESKLDYYRKYYSTIKITYIIKHLIYLDVIILRILKKYIKK